MLYAEQVLFIWASETAGLMLAFTDWATLASASLYLAQFALAFYIDRCAGVSVSYWEWILIIQEAVNFHLKSCAVESCQTFDFSLISVWPGLLAALTSQYYS